MACNVGIVGLGVMGENLALNLVRHGYAVAVYNRTSSRTRGFIEDRAVGTGIVGTYDLNSFVDVLTRPRRVLLLVKAGSPVDELLDKLVPYLQPGDVVVDGGNSFFLDTERRAEKLAPQKLLYVGMGVSGGEAGALNGPSLMPGGPRQAYDLLEPMLVAIAATTDAGATVTYVGPGGSGHYVKMVHNGIEYAVMQLIAESYDVLRRALGMDAAAIGEVFARWNEGKLASLLVEVTAAVLRFVDAETGYPLVDRILDQAEQKGTGRWTSQNALELASPTPTIDAAVAARILSAQKAQRALVSKLIRGPRPKSGTATTVGGRDRDHLVGALEDALYFAMVSSYIQGFTLMHAASKAYGYGFNLAEIARIWRGGCIIRAKLLDPIRVAFKENLELDNLLLAPHLSEAINAVMDGARETLGIAHAFGIPVSALGASLDYVDTFRQEFLPANLIQAQRDFFGAHTYRRRDKPGTFHTVWTPVGTWDTVASSPSRRQLWEGGEEEGERST